LLKKSAELVGGMSLPVAGRLPFDIIDGSSELMMPVEQVLLLLTDNGWSKCDDCEDSTLT
jgi:hypothetical protein